MHTHTFTQTLYLTHTHSNFTVACPLCLLNRSIIITAKLVRWLYSQCKVRSPLFITNLLLFSPDTLHCGSNPELSLENAYRQATGVYTNTYNAWAREMQGLVAAVSCLPLLLVWTLGSSLYLLSKALCFNQLNSNWCGMHTIWQSVRMITHTKTTGDHRVPFKVMSHLNRNPQWNIHL